MQRFISREAVIGSVRVRKRETQQEFDILSIAVLEEAEGRRCASSRGIPRMNVVTA